MPSTNLKKAWLVLTAGPLLISTLSSYCSFAEGSPYAAVEPWMEHSFSPSTDVYSEVSGISRMSMLSMEFVQKCFYLPGSCAACFRSCSTTFRYYINEQSSFLDGLGTPPKAAAAADGKQLDG